MIQPERIQPEIIQVNLLWAESEMIRSASVGDDPISVPTNCDSLGPAVSLSSSVKMSALVGPPSRTSILFSCIV